MNQSLPETKNRGWPAHTSVLVPFRALARAVGRPSSCKHVEAKSARLTRIHGVVLASQKPYQAMVCSASHWRQVPHRDPSFATSRAWVSVSGTLESR